MERERLFVVYRAMDDVGRVTIPRDIRRLLDWSPRTNLLIAVEENGVYITKADDTIK